MQASISKYFQKRPRAEEKAAAPSDEKIDKQNSKRAKAPAVELTQEGDGSAVSSSSSQTRPLTFDFEHDDQRSLRFQRAVEQAEHAVAAREEAQAEGGEHAAGMAVAGKGSSSQTKLTPLEKQVVELKVQAPGTVLMVHCGYRIRFFGEDALIAAKVLSIYAHKDHSFMVASIPTHRVAVHLRRLIMAGYKVGIVRQTETEALRKAKKTKSATFERSIAAVFTPGTVIDDDDPAFADLLVGSQGQGRDDDENDEGDDFDDDAREELGAATQATAGISGTPALSTPSTPQDRWILSLYESIDPITAGRVLGAVVLDITAGQLRYAPVSIDAEWVALHNVLEMFQPCEVLMPRTASPQLQAQLNDWKRRRTDMPVRLEFVLSRVYQQPLPALASMSSSGEPLPEACLRAIQGLESYLQSMKLTARMDSFVVQPFKSAGECLLDSVTSQDLELFQVQTPSGRPQECGSLFWLLNHTKTPFGRRKLRDWIQRPLVKAAQIRARQDAVEFLLRAVASPMQTLDAAASWIKAVANSMETSDLERLVASVHFLRASPKRLLQLLRSSQTVCSAILQRTPDVQDVPALIESTLSAELAEALAAGIERVLTKINPEAAKSDDFVNVLSDTYAAQHAKLLQAKEAREAAHAAIEAEIVNIRAVLHVSSLQYKHLRTGPTSTTEYLIEVPKEIVSRVPKEWMRVNQTKQVVRYHSPTVLELYQRLMEARDELQIVSKLAWTELLQEVDAELYVLLRSLIDNLAVFDALSSLAHVARFVGYCRPTIVDESDEAAPTQITIAGARHPTVEQLLAHGGDQYVPNDVVLNFDTLAPNSLVITGPNMGGKSSYVRMIAICCIMAQIGSYVPADAATVFPLEGIFTRMGAGDDLAAGVSTFMLELSRTSLILQRSTARSLVILDELGRGTSTHDGVAIAMATLKYLSQSIRCATLFVTHFPQLEQLKTDPACAHNIRFAHMDFLETPSQESPTGSEITFLYKLKEDASCHSHGLNVARLAGLDDDLLRVARERAAWMMSTYGTIGLQTS